MKRHFWNPEIRRNLILIPKDELSRVTCYYADKTTEALTQLTSSELPIPSYEISC